LLFIKKQIEGRLPDRN